MSQLYISSPVRSPCPRPVDAGSPALLGPARQGNAPRYRGVALPPASPAKRLHFPSSQNPNTAQNGPRDVATEAASYTSRGDTAAEAHARRAEDEEHGATQLILLLTLSVVLLTLPWVVDHPVTLLVPVALFILPITSGALRSLVAEGFALISGGIRWFWRHRRARHAHATVQSAPGAASQRTPPSPQPAAPPPFIHNAQQTRVWQSSGAFPASQQPEQWQAPVPSMSYPGSRGIINQHARVAATMQPANAPGTCPRAGGMPPKAEWQGVVQRSHPELTTPDLDFDSDGETATHEDARGRYVGYDRPYTQAPYVLTHAQVVLDRCNQPVQQQQGDAQHTTTQRPPLWMRSTDQAECTIRNWDEADECTQRRGHRPLSDLLNNVH